jgi:hypothetical protein
MMFASSTARSASFNSLTTKAATTNDVSLGKRVRAASPRRTSDLSPKAW